VNGPDSFGATLASIMERRYVAAIDVAREVGVATRQVERWLRDDAAPSVEDVRTLASLLGGADGQRLLAAGPMARVASQSEAAPSSRTLSPTELAVLGDLPPAFKAEFAAAFSQSEA
jgi:hypothetical protein